MSRFSLLTKCALVLSSAALLAGAFQGKPEVQTKPEERAKPAVEEKKASIEGTVVDAASGKPLKDVSLMLMGAAAAGSPSAATSNEAGHFSIKNLEAGSYMLFATHPRYARQMYGSRDGLMGGTRLAIAAGQELREIIFKLQPNSVISGKVVDEEGEPLKDVMVSALKSIYQRGRRQQVPVGTATTNDLGEFRVGNLAQGKYLVAAMMMKQGGGTPAQDGTESGYLTTFYPNSPEASGAATVSVGAGTETGGTDIRLIKTKAVRVKGKVMGMTAGQRLTVRLFPKDGGVLGLISARSASVKPTDGSFEIAAVTAGTYELRAMDLSAFRAASPGTPLEVRERPVEGLIVEVVQAPDVNGEILLDGEQNPKPSFKAQRIYLESLDGLTTMPPMTNAAEDGTFQLKAVPKGKYFVRVMPAPDGSYVSAITFGDQKMGEDGLEIGAAGTAKLEIKLRPAAAQVEGAVQDTEGKPVPGVTVALIPKSKSYLLYQAAMTDQKGTFSFKSVTPEDYLLLALDGGEPGSFYDPEFVKPFESKGEKITLKENDRKGVTLKLISKD
ncbi:MAG: carboxypeptidase-like regulatory domain-containing protein [Acidobacteriales bacterium]|nr:carboxypeptidase-like regulatory domain-containing protein [Terriglobales bacterium]